MLYISSCEKVKINLSHFPFLQFSCTLHSKHSVQDIWKWRDIFPWLLPKSFSFKVSDIALLHTVTCNGPKELFLLIFFKETTTRRSHQPTNDKLTLVSLVTFNLTAFMSPKLNIIEGFFNKFRPIYQCIPNEEVM